MSEPVILISGANGEIGHGLIYALANLPETPAILALDLNPLSASLQPHVKFSVQGDILDARLLARLNEQYHIETVFHLAAILSSQAERIPQAAHRVNVEGTLNLLQLTSEQAQRHGQNIPFLFPSSIAVYGIADLQTKRSLPPLKETSYNLPITMYGCNKLYGELLGRFYSHPAMPAPKIDFRALRFPGIISAHTEPVGGSTDYLPQMLHSANRGQSYAAFVRADTTLPFITMPDATRALIELWQAPKSALTDQVYNITSWSCSAAEFAARVRQSYPNAQIEFDPNPTRQRIVDSWPASLDDSAARKDWGWRAQHDMENAFLDYLLPILQGNAPDAT